MEEHTHTIRPQTESAALEKRIFRVSNLPPRTLLWRIFLLFALLLVLVFGIWGQIFNYYHDEPVRARDAARMAVNMVNLTREALINTDPGRRNDFLIALSTLEKIHIYPAEPDDEIQPLPDSREMRLFVDEARRGLGENTRFASRWKTLDGLWISFHLTMPSDPDEYWIMLPFDRGSYQSAYAWLFWGGASLLAAILAAYLIVSHISLPLRRLAHAARQIGSGQTPAPFEEKGPLEIAVVAKAFNQMTASLTRAADDRALLLAGVSHDLRTPLARLRLETELQDTAFDRASMIADIEAMDRIIGQFLDYGRDTARTPMQPVDLVPLIAHIAAPYIQRGTQIKIDAPPQLPARAHPLSLSRAICNLLDNALRYAGEDKPIDIRLYSMDAAACIAIADRGPGIPPGEIERMRQPFTRLENARSNAPGAGLGLAIVDRIITLHGGRFDLLPRKSGGLRAILRIRAFSEESV